MMFRKILIANRGEIAVRIARACREMDIESVAVYSDADRDAPHVRAADHAVHIGPSAATESYLRIPAIIEAARSAECDALHPGYGFLAENAGFARAVSDAGVVFIGPSPAAIETMGDKVRARQIAESAGVPLAPSCELREGETPQDLGNRIGFPVLVKAAAGGGGKGMRIVRSQSELETAIESARREAGSAFGDDRVYLERFVERARHIEVQVLGDHHGGILHIGERECSIQRRHQKIIEESPAPAIAGETRQTLTTAALALARSVDYANAGTVEFLVDGSDVFFLEMNTRLQVEHPVTEWVYSIDLVQAQIRIAAGERLWLRQDEISERGHAIECRIYAEDPARDFSPSPARIDLLRTPEAPWLRFDSGIREGFTIPLEYDPMLAKLSAWGETREQARSRIIAALEELAILGPITNGSFLIDVLRQPKFQNGETTTAFLAEHLANWTQGTADLPIALAAAALQRPAVRTRDGRATEAAQDGPWQRLGGWRPFQS